MTVSKDNRFTRILMQPRAEIKSFCFINKRGKDTERREMRRNF